MAKRRVNQFRTAAKRRLPEIGPIEVTISQVRTVELRVGEGGVREFCPDEGYPSVVALGEIQLAEVNSLKMQGRTVRIFVAFDATPADHKHRSPDVRAAAWVLVLGVGAHVCAEYFHYSRVIALRFAGDALKREDATEANGWVLVPELFDRFREPVSDLPIMEGRQVLIGNVEATKNNGTTYELDESGSKLVLEPDFVIWLVFVAGPPQLQGRHQENNTDKKAEARYQYQISWTSYQLVISQRALPPSRRALHL
jgi:hypothetical protein